MKNIYLKLLLLCVICCIHFSVKAQLISGNSYMQGNFVEVGVTPCGSYGTSPTPPPGYHPRSPGGGLGFVADFGRDGWSAGSPSYCGDYFLPGSPVEGWGVEVSGTSYINSDVCGISTVPGSILSYTNVGGVITTIWQGTVASGPGAGLRVTQTTTLKAADLFFITSISLCNTSGSTMTNVYYGRNVDPDNDIMLGGSYTTRNIIEAQPRADSCASLVTSTGLNFGCFLALGAMQQNARVSVGGFSTVAPISGIYRGSSGGTGRDTTLGHNTTSDEAISIGYYWASLPPGGCVDANFAYLLNRADLAAALAGLGSPSISSGSVDISTTLRDTLCGRGSFVLSVTADTSYHWTWGPASVLDTTEGNTVVVSSDTTVTISLYGYSNECSSVNKTITLVRDTFLNLVGAARDTVVCGGLPVVLNPSVRYDSAFALTYSWTPSSSLSSSSIPNPVATAPYTTTYYLSASNGACDIKDTVTVYRVTDGTFNQTICPGFPITVGSNTYSTTGVYRDTFRGGIPGCDSIMVTTISAVDTISTIADTSICAGEVLNLTTTSTDVSVPYLWSPSTGLSSTTVASPVATPTVSTTYIVRTTVGACYNYDTVNVIVRGSFPEVSSTITPNPYCKGDTLLLNAGVASSSPDSSITYNYTGARQTFTVPSGVTSINIDVRGAQGGTASGYAGGLGARMQGSFTVTPGQILDVVVGGVGITSYNSGSGGGGSGVLFGTTPWIIAGGGGGASASNYEVGGPGLTGTSGGNSSGPGGSAGSGGQKGYVNGDCGWSAGGGGYSGDGYGGNGTWDGGPLPGALGTLGGAKSWLNGGAGGSNGGCTFSYPNIGPFGCGGGGCGSYGGGGGGGYSGGGAGQYVAGSGQRGGGGGGSYNIGTSTSSTEGFQTGNGQINISWASPIITGPTTYTWTPSSSLFSRTDTSYTYTVATSAVDYIVTVSRNGCTTFDTLKIRTPLDIHITPDTTICAGNPVALNAIIDYDSTASPAGPDSLVLTYSGAMQTFTVPTGVTSITVDAYGAQGGNAVGYASGWSSGSVNRSGGYGGRVEATLTVTPGQVLNLFVGGQGSISSGGFNGGGAPASCSGTEVIWAGGGGATDIRTGGTAYTDRILVAGGGGGAAGSASSSYVGTGGNGGGLTGANGTSASGTCLNGLGGTSSAGGIGGNQSCWCGSGTAPSGTFGDGAASICSPSGLSTCSCSGTGCVSGAGGGGGYYGGGAGLSYAGGGGGSSYTGGSSSSVTHTQGVQSGNGQLILRWTSVGSVPPTFTWSPTIGLSSTSILDPIATTLTSVDYIITATAGSCIVSDTASLFIHPGDSTYQDRSVCSGYSVTVGAHIYSSTGLYKDTLVSRWACQDSIVMTNLIVLPLPITNQTISICPGAVYTINAHNYSSSGLYRDTFDILGFCDSIVNTTLVILPTSAHTTNLTICSNESYLFNGVYENTSGIYLDTFINYVGCDSVETLDLIVNPTSIGLIDVSICDRSSYLFNGENLNTPGIYLDTLSNSLGCDSFLTLVLRIIPSTTASIDAAICSGDYYNFNGVDLGIPGTYFDTLVNYEGCDSFVTLNLIENPVTSATINNTLCDGQTYFFNDENISSAGIYFDTLINYTGCDSFLTLNLTVNPTSSTFLNITICEGESFTVGSSTYTVSGDYQDTLSNLYGCDSVISTNLKVKMVNYSNTVSLCDGESIIAGGAVRTVSGVYYDSLISSVGCDSIISTYLTVNRKDSVSNSVAICKGDLYQGLLYESDTIIHQNESNIYGCDSIVVTNLTVNLLPAVSAGNDTTINLGSSAGLMATGADSYSWNNGIFSAFNIVAPEISTTYYVTGTDLNNCSNIDTVNVFVRDDSTAIAIPNAFTPNGDGLNDVFRILLSPNLGISECRVFNRWGSIIFESKDVSNCWDGSFEGKQQPIGSYVYFVVTKDIYNGNLKSYTGTVSLLR